MEASTANLRRDNASRRTVLALGPRISHKEFTPIIKRGGFAPDGVKCEWLQNPQIYFKSQNHSIHKTTTHTNNTHTMDPRLFYPNTKLDPFSEIPDDYDLLQEFGTNTFEPQQMPPLESLVPKPLPLPFEPKQNTKMELFERISAWFEAIPFVKIGHNKWLDYCYPPIAYPGDAPDNFEYNDSLDVIESQARMITRYTILNYMNESVPFDRSGVSFNYYYDNEYDLEYNFNPSQEFLLYKEELETGLAYFQ